MLQINHSETSLFLFKARNFFWHKKRMAKKRFENKQLHQNPNEKMTSDHQIVSQSLESSTSQPSNSNPNAYVQIATPKSPNSDGFSPQQISDLHFDSSIETEIKQKLADEIDIEILLKHREYNLVQNEISKVEAQMETLSRIHDDPEYVKYIENLVSDQSQSSIKQTEQLEPSSNMWTPSIRKSSLRNQSSDNDSSSPPKQHRTSYGGLRPVIDANGNKICVHKRSDGVIVRIDCPSCGRTDFGSAQGFLNHARLAHQIEYKSQDHAALMCGRCLDAVEQDEIGNSSIAKLKELKLNPNRNLAPGVVIEDGQPLKKKRKSSSKHDESSGFLETLYKRNNDTDDFKELIDDVTTKEVIDLEEPEASDATEAPGSNAIEAPASTSNQPSSVGSTTNNSILLNNFKKNHNRRKSRGGLSAVTFDESSFEDRPSSSTVEGESSETDDIILIGSQSLSEYEQRRLTPAQRRRVPTIPNPLRTRSRSSRENSR